MRTQCRTAAAPCLHAQQAEPEREHRRARRLGHRAHLHLQLIRVVGAEARPRRALVRRVCVGAQRAGSAARVALRVRPAEGARAARAHHEPVGRERRQHRGNVGGEHDGLQCAARKQRHREGGQQRAGAIDAVGMQLGDDDGRAAAQAGEHVDRRQHLACRTGRERLGSPALVDRHDRCRACRLVEVADQHGGGARQRCAAREQCGRQRQREQVSVHESSP